MTLAIAFASLPAGAHASGAAERGVSVVRSVVPQGWGFFTKDPRSPFMSAWTLRSGDGWRPAERGPNLTVRNLFGLNRASRLDEYDISQITSGEDLDEEWTECTGSGPAGCGTLAEESAGVQQWSARGYDLRLCGDVLLLRTEPVPFDFAGLDYDPRTDAIRATVRCEHLAARR